MTIWKERVGMNKMGLDATPLHATPLHSTTPLEGVSLPQGRGRLDLSTVVVKVMVVLEFMGWSGVE